MEDLLSREIFSNVQAVVKDIITEGKCQDVDGSEFYERLLSKLGFFTGLIIRPNQAYIVSTFDTKIQSLRTESGILKKYCSLATEANVNKLILLFLNGQPELISSWNTYLDTKSRGGRRKTITCNRKKTKKKKRMKNK
jgi:hypothetical protein